MPLDVGYGPPSPPRRQQQMVDWEKLRAALQAHQQQMEQMQQMQGGGAQAGAPQAGFSQGAGTLFGGPGAQAPTFAPGLAPFAQVGQQQPSMQDALAAPGPVQQDVMNEQLNRLFIPYFLSRLER